MIRLLVGCSLLFFATSLAFSNDRNLNGIDSLDTRQLVQHAHEQWEDYKRQYNKEYDNVADKVHRNLFVESVIEIEMNNRKYVKGESSYELGLNHMADWTPSQYNQFIGAPIDAPFDNSTVYHVSEENAARPVSNDATISWRTTPVKNQGGCGCGYAFAAVGALETAYARKTGSLVSLSEQNILDCSGKNGNYGCNGGFATASFECVKQSGINAEAKYPYEERVNTCRYNPSGKVTGVSSYVSCPNEAALQNALQTVGSVAIGIDVTPKSFTMYTNGVYDNSSGCSNQPNHMMLAIGMGTTPDGKDYYLVKNSWGTSWGQQGYVKIGRGTNACGITVMVSYPVV